MKLTISSNYQPRIGGSDEGIWGRTVLVPWLEYIPLEERDLQLGDKLKLEASGVLNRLLDGLRDYLERGLDQPAAVLAATAEYRSSTDQVGRFLEACTERDEKGRVQSSVLLELHNAWARANAGSEYKGFGFAKAMEERGFRRTKVSVAFWIGLKLTKTINDFVDRDGRPLQQSEAAEPGDRAPDQAKDEEVAF